MCVLNTPQVFPASKVPSLAFPDTPVPQEVGVEPEYQIDEKSPWETPTFKEQGSDGGTVWRGSLKWMMMREKESQDPVLLVFTAFSQLAICGFSALWIICEDSSTIYSIFQLTVD